MQSISVHVSKIFHRVLRQHAWLTCFSFASGAGKVCGICLPEGCGACSFRRSPKPHGQPNGDQVYSTHHARAKKGLLTTLLNLSDAKLLLLACSCSARNCNTIEAGCWVTIICDVIWLPSLFYNLLTLTCLQCLSCLLSGLCNGPTLCFSII